MTLAPASLLTFRTAAGPAGIMLDFDGTLSPIVARPDLARIAEGARETLADLAGRYAVVAVISGRTHPELEALVGVEGVRLEAAYGMQELPDLPLPVLDEVRAAARRVTGARVEPKIHSVAVHVRGVPDPERAEASLRGPLSYIAGRHGLELIEGKRTLELIPAGRPLKEGAVARVVEEHGLVAVIYAGDDLADLRAFKELDERAERGLHVVKVAVLGPETPTGLVASADLTVDGPAGLIELLRTL